MNHDISGAFMEKDKADKMLADLVVKATKLTKDSIGKNAFKNIFKTATIKCPKKLLELYQTIFLKPGGAPKTVIFTK